jgi:hypothetical protein
VQNVIIHGRLKKLVWFTTGTLKMRRGKIVIADGSITWMAKQKQNKKRNHSESRTWSHQEYLTSWQDSQPTGKKASECFVINTSHCFEVLSFIRTLIISSNEFFRIVWNIFLKLLIYLTICDTNHFTYWREFTNKTMIGKWGKVVTYYAWYILPSFSSQENVLF